MPSNFQREPSADVRSGSMALFEWFVALMQAGFSDDQAIRIIGATIGYQNINLDEDE